MNLLLLSILTILPLEFTSGAKVSIQIDSAAFKDISGNPFLGIKNDNTWKFTILRYSDVTIVSKSPGHNAVNIPLNTNLVINFSQAMRKGQGNITINPFGNEKQVIDVLSANVQVSDSRVTIFIPRQFGNQLQNEVVIDMGAFLDMSGAPFEGIGITTAWYFTTNNGIQVEQVVSDKFFQIYPSPTSGEFTLKYEENNAKNLKLQIFNMLGKNVYEKYLSSPPGFYAENIYPGDISKGIYLINIESETGSHTLKLSVVE